MFLGTSVRRSVDESVVAFDWRASSRQLGPTACGRLSIEGSSRCCRRVAHQGAHLGQALYSYSVPECFAGPNAGKELWCGRFAAGNRICGDFFGDVRELALSRIVGSIRQGRSRPFPPKAVIGPAFTPGERADLVHGCRQPRLRGSCAGRCSPANGLKPLKCKKARKRAWMSRHVGVLRTRRKRRAYYRCAEMPVNGHSTSRHLLHAPLPLWVDFDMLVLGRDAARQDKRARASYLLQGSLAA
jgi:hypothetical protein